MLWTEKPGSELTMKFEGSAVGAYVLAGPDAGMVEASIDGAPFQKVDLWHPYSGGLHYPRTVMFAVDLKPGMHTLALRSTKDKNKGSLGFAVRIVQLVAN